MYSFNTSVDKHTDAWIFVSSGVSQLKTFLLKIKAITD